MKHIPRYSDRLEILLLLYRDGTTEQKQTALRDLQRMANAADLFNQIVIAKESYEKK